MYTQTIIFAIIVFLFLVIGFIDYKIYINTVYLVRRNWLWWRYLPYGAVIARYKYRKTE